jgi:hypothetical protein
MKNRYLMNDEEKREEVKKRILRSATAMFNACKKSYQENKCKGCPFKTDIGCLLYDHPIEWEQKLKSAKS